MSNPTRPKVPKDVSSHFGSLGRSTSSLRNVDLKRGAELSALTEDLAVLFSAVFNSLSWS